MANQKREKDQYLVKTSGIVFAVSCCCVRIFARNMAYYRAGHARLTKSSPQFWISVDGNFIDIVVIEWCKLLGDRKGKHFWANVVGDPSRFEAAMLSHLGMTASELSTLPPRKVRRK